LWVDVDIILVARSDGKVQFWSVPGSSLLHTLCVEGEVRDVEYSFSLRIVTVAANNLVSFFSVSVSRVGAGGNEISVHVHSELLKEYKMPIHFRDEGGASLHPSGTKFIAGGNDLWVRVFDYSTGEELECHKGHHGPIRCLRFSPDGKTFATGSEDGTIRLWKTDVGS